MAGYTVFRCALEDAIDMAAFAIHVRVFAIQVEGKLGVIDTRVLPAVFGMTCSTVGSELTVVVIVLQVAGYAIFRGAFEYAIHMATLAIHIRMFAVQVEGEFRVVDRGRFPTRRGMTGGAFGTELPVVMIILQVARNTILRGALEDAVLMAAFTGH